ncbi:hypothetical protein PIB30_026972 [Stylosanthes scabra]|uniref:Uncharacterized protein n=1 Tax=Stylosanthes scabra TaxID=79078 RepID=A0ABU6QA15_9FABA|nr:hypothetical protein [Stylosanthes scabra]
MTGKEDHNHDPEPASGDEPNSNVKLLCHRKTNHHRHLVKECSPLSSTPPSSLAAPPPGLSLSLAVTKPLLRIPGAAAAAVGSPAEEGKWNFYKEKRGKTLWIDLQSSDGSESNDLDYCTDESADDDDDEVEYEDSDD